MYEFTETTQKELEQERSELMTKLTMVEAELEDTKKELMKSVHQYRFSHVIDTNESKHWFAMYIRLK
jgi:hypothetical protein